jgi:hypothetical protein
MGDTMAQKFKQSKASIDNVMSIIGQSAGRSLQQAFTFDSSTVITAARVIITTLDILGRVVAGLTGALQTGFSTISLAINVFLVKPISVVINGLIELLRVGLDLGAVLGEKFGFSTDAINKMNASLGRVNESIKSTADGFIDGSTQMAESGAKLTSSLWTQSEFAKQATTDLNAYEASLKNVSTTIDTTGQKINSTNANIASTPQIIKEGGTSIGDMFANLGAGFSASQAQHDAYTKEFQSNNGQITTAMDATIQKMQQVGRAALTVGQNIKKGIGQGIGSGFAAFGAALVNGENALDAFAKAFLSTLGQMMIQQGTAFILQGLGYMFIPGLQGNGGPLIAAGSALAALGGALTAVGAKGANKSVGGAGDGGDMISSGSSFDSEEFKKQEMQKPDTKVTVNVYGSIMDSDETGTRIVDLINNAYDKQGVVINKGAIA